MANILISGVLVGALSLSGAWMADSQPSQHNAGELMQPGKVLRMVPSVPAQFADAIPVRRPVRTQLADAIPVRPPVPAQFADAIPVRRPVRTQLADAIPVRPPVPAALA